MAVARGLVTPDVLRGPRYRALYRDVHVAADVPVTHALRVRAAAGVLRPGAVVTGRSAAVLWGIDLAGPEDDVELTLPPDAHPVRSAGVRVRRAALDPRRVCTHRGVRVTDPVATTVALAGSLPLEEAVVAVDRMTVSGVAGLAEVRALAAVQVGRGCRRARTPCALADGLAQSPQETRLRLLMGWGGLPTPVAQHRVVHGGRFVADVDFGWPAHRVAVEYDGLWHAEPGQFAKDRQRLNRLTAAGWRVVFVTAADLYRPEALIARIAALLTA
ncbi:endonuclease domain-containing protein [Modestobacter muralis]|uniref:endonuclease domain-containing protein n=1 Tax=Modestobacter muralis TaxID=1608614 RepID=UPI0030B87A23